MTRAFFAVIALSLFLAAPGDAAIYVVRHAEKASPSAGMADNPPLTAAGRKRAADLARVLRSVKLEAVYVTQYLRTRQTGAPTAKEFSLTPIVVKADDTAALAKTLRAAGDRDVLVVAHSDTIPDLLKDLSVPDGPKEELPSNDYDNLFVVDLSTAGARLDWLHYGPENP